MGRTRNVQRNNLALDDHDLVGELLLLKKSATRLVDRTAGTVREATVRRVVSNIQDAILDIRETKGGN